MGHLEFLVWQAGKRNLRYTSLAQYIRSYCMLPAYKPSTLYINMLSFVHHASRRCPATELHESDIAIDLTNINLDHAYYMYCVRIDFSNDS